MTQITAPIRASYLYRFEAASQVITLTNTVSPLGAPVVYNDESYTDIQMTHTAPTYSAQASDAEIEVTIFEQNDLADLFINGPAAYPIILTIYEYDHDAETATAYYRGWVVRVPFRLDSSLMTLRCKSVWHFFERETMTDSLSALSRYSVYDPRAGIDMDALRVAVTVATVNDERDVLTVTGITQIDDWFKGGIIVAPNLDKRTILNHTGSTLQLNAGFPEFTLDVGFNADIYPGDDLTYDTWANKFSAESNNGEAWGGWQYMPNIDPAKRGVI